MTFNELLLDAIKFDEVWMAYSVYWLIKNDVYKGTDSIKQVNWGLINEEEVKQMMERNDLNLNPVKLYTIPLGNDLHFLVFALTEESARGHCLNELGRLPEKIFDISQKMEMRIMDKKLLVQAITKLLIGVLIVGALVFIPAGTFEYWNGWLFMGLLFIPMFIAGII